MKYHISSAIWVALLAMAYTVRSVHALTTPAVTGCFETAPRVSGGTIGPTVLCSSNSPNSNENGPSSSSSNKPPMFYAAARQAKKQGKVDPLAAASLSKEQFGIGQVQASPAATKKSESKPEPPAVPVPTDQSMNVPSEEDFLTDADKAMESINALLESIDDENKSYFNPKEPFRGVRLESAVAVASGALKGAMNTALNKAKEISKTEASQTPFPTDMQIKPAAKSQNAMQAFVSDALDETKNSEPKRGAPADFVKPAPAEDPKTPFPTDMQIKSAEVSKTSGSEAFASPIEPTFENYMPSIGEEPPSVIEDSTSSNTIDEMHVEEEVGEEESKIVAEADSSSQEEPQQAPQRSIPSSAGIRKSGMSPEEEEAQSKALAKFWELSAQAKAEAEKVAYDKTAAEIERQRAQTEHDPAVAKFWEISAQTSEPPSERQASSTQPDDAAPPPMQERPKPTRMTPDPRGFNSALVVQSARTQTASRATQSSSRSWPPQQTDFFAPPVGKSAVNREKVPQSTRNMLHSTSNSFFSAPGMGTVQSSRSGQAASAQQAATPQLPSGANAEGSSPEEDSANNNEQAAGGWSEAPRVPPSSFTSLGSTFDNRRDSLTSENNNQR